jgi:carbamoyl-phosphate synthase large subunit
MLAIGLPCIIRPSFTLGGTGGGIAYNRDEFLDIVEKGLDASPTSEVLIEESVLGWKEYEMEVVRDKADNCIIICSIENIDPMGVHTGDSITVAPALTLTDKEYQIMRNASIAVLREIGIETGGSNVQFAVNPPTAACRHRNEPARVALLGTGLEGHGLPIAKVAAKLAIGYTLDELANDITGGATRKSFEPTIDYVVTKIPRFAFEKFPGSEPLLTTAMKSVGEVMAIGRTFQESFQKALRGLETGSLASMKSPSPVSAKATTRNAIRAASGQPTPDRLLKIAQALRHGATVEQINASCHYRAVVPAPDQEIVAHGRSHQGTRACRAMPRTCASSRRWASPTSAWPNCGPQRKRRLRRTGASCSAPGVQAHRHLCRRIRLADGLHVFDL